MLEPDEQHSVELLDERRPLQPNRLPMLTPVLLISSSLASWIELNISQSSSPKSPRVENLPGSDGAARPTRPVVRHGRLQCARASFAPCDELRAAWRVLVWDSRVRSRSCSPPGYALVIIVAGFQSCDCSRQSRHQAYSAS